MLQNFVYDALTCNPAIYAWMPDETIKAFEDAKVPLHGMCADFALMCRRKLRENGINSTLVYCTTETGDPHLVCSVDGNILDNRQQRVISNTALEFNGYKFISESGDKPGEPWHLIER